jgi:hypothetical protein
MPSPLPLAQLPGVNHEHGAILVHDEDDLEQPAASARAPDEQLVLADPPRKGALGFPDYLFGFVRIDSVPSEMFDVPLVPTEVHQASSPSIVAHVFCFFNKNLVRALVA